MNAKININKLILICIFILIYGGVIIMQPAQGLGKKPEMLSEKETSKLYYKNPLGITGIGDPFVLKASDGRYYCYATSASDGFKVWSSKNLVNWKEEGHAYTYGNKSWGYKDFWAPEVVEYKGKYYMYYSARWSKNDSLRIGLAVSTNPKGPFIDVQNHPLFDFGYAAIDGNLLLDSNGRKYLYYSRDCSENIINGRHESHIYAVRLNDNMLSVIGKPVLIAKPEQKWELESGAEWIWNEGPTVFKHNNLYYMMYSANVYSSPKYSIGYAVSKTPLGPFVKSKDNPIVSAEMNMDEISGPGHNSIVFSPDNNERLIVYHTHTDVFAGGGDRQVNIDRFGFRKDGSIFVNGPTISDQLMPSSKEGLHNIALNAEVEVSSLKIGYNKHAVNDNEIGIYPRLEKNEYASSQEDKNPWIKLSWEKSQSISGVMIYGSSISKRNAITGKLLFSNGMEIDNLKLPKRSGEALVFNFKKINVSWVKFIVKENTPNNEFGLSEIMVLQ